MLQFQRSFHRVSEKTNKPIPRKLTNRPKDPQKDGQTLFHKTKKENKGKKEKVSKLKLLKDCYQGENIIALVTFTVLF